MKTRARILAVLSVLALALAASAANFTTFLDVLEAHVRNQADTAPVGDQIAYTVILGKLDTLDTTTIRGDLVRAEAAGKKAVKTGIFKRDGVVAAQLNALPALFSAEIRLRLDQVQAQLDAFQPTVKRTKKKRALALRKLKAASKKLDRIDASPLYSKGNFKKLKAADAQITKAQGILAKFPKPTCSQGVAFENGEGGFVTRNGIMILFTHYEFEQVPQSGGRWFRLFTCDPDFELELLLRAPQPGPRAIGDRVDEDNVRIRDGFAGAYSGGFEGSADTTTWDVRFAPGGGGVVIGDLVVSFACSNGNGETLTGGQIVINDFFRGEIAGN